MSFYSDVFWGLDWMVLSLVVVFYLFPFLLSSHLSKMGVLKYYFSSFWWWCAVKQILNIFFVFPIVGLFNSAKRWKLGLMNWVKHIKYEKTAYLLLKGKSCFWSIQPIKNSIMKALSCCLRYFCLETQDLKSLFMQRHLVHFLIYNRLSFQKRDVWNGSREINGFCQQIHFLLYFL